MRLCWRLLGIATLLATLLTLAGCAISPPFDATGFTTQPYPDQVDATGDIGKKLLWGGVIVQNQPLASGSRLEILAYPLGAGQQPQSDATPVGRFLALRSGFLEPVDYAPGRMVTLTGTLTRFESGRIGEVDYQYPLLEIEAIHRWPRRGPEEPQFHFGVGVSISR